jgi:hypothetical protein
LVAKVPIIAKRITAPAKSNIPDTFTMNYPPFFSPTL